MSTAELQSLHDAIRAEGPLVWLFTGDSITHGLTHTQGQRSYPEHLHELIRGDFGRVRDVVVNTAISGNRIADILADWRWRVDAWQPNIVSLMIGTNDCAVMPDAPVVEPAQFAESLAEFVDRVRAVPAIPILQTPPPLDDLHCPERSRFAEFAAAVRETAVRRDVILIDQLKWLSGFGYGEVPFGLLGDPIHPNAAGHAAMARQFAHVTGLEFPGSRVLALLDGVIAAAH